MALQRTKCPACGVTLKTEGVPAGKTMRCPKCDHRFMAAAPIPVAQMAPPLSPPTPQPMPAASRSNLRWLVGCGVAVMAVAFMAVAGLGIYVATRPGSETKVVDGPNPDKKPNDKKDDGPNSDKKPSDKQDDGPWNGGKSWPAFVPVAKSWKTRETPLLNAQQAAKQLVPKSFLISPDGRRYAYVLKEGGDEVVMLDGKPHVQFQKSPESFGGTAGPLAFSGDGKHFICAGTVGAKTGGVEHMYVDGLQVLRLGTTYPGTERVWLNHDGSQYARLNRGQLNINGAMVHHPLRQPGKPIVTATENISYVTVSSKATVVVNGSQVVLGSPIGGDDRVIVAASGEHFIFLTSQDREHFAVLNGQQQKRFDEIPHDSLRFSADGNHYAHFGRDGKEWCVLHDNKRHELPGWPGGKFTQPGEKPMEAIGTLTLSPDGTRWASEISAAGDWKFGAAGRWQEPARAYTVINGQKGKEYAAVHPIKFSPDSKHYANAAIRAVKVEKKPDPGKPKPKEPIYEYHVNPLIVRDGAEQDLSWIKTEIVNPEDVEKAKSNAASTINLESFFFSPDSKHLAYLATEKSGGSQFLTVNKVKFGKEYAKYHDKVAPSFSPDSKSLGCVVKRRGEWFAVLDGSNERTGKDGVGYDDIGPEGTRVGFTPEGNYTYLAIRQGAIYWVEEMRDGKEYARPKAIEKPQAKESKEKEPSPAIKESKLDPKSTPLGKPGEWVPLFNGKDLTGWTNLSGKPAPWKVEKDYMEVVPGKGSIMTEKRFPLDFEMHAEFWLPRLPGRFGQARANSGIYLLGRHEIQILDMVDNPDVNPIGGCGALFGMIAPKPGGIKPPETWQTFDITYRGPRKGAGTALIPGRLTVIHNGALVIDNAPVATALSPGLPQITDVGQPGPIVLQEFGAAVRFRNLKLRPLTPPA